MSLFRVSHDVTAFSRLKGIQLRERRLFCKPVFKRMTVSDESDMWRYVKWVWVSDSAESDTENMEFWWCVWWIWWVVRYEECMSGGGGYRQI